eukprot:FR735392.1.p1 GENE.FR735392.1~~FR735392.1.p1  ORF type:complete len:100 (+),score=7.50 FR735392.1:219-518(+)
MCFMVTQVLKVLQLVPMAATPGEVKDLLAPGFTGLTADCGGENINKNTVDEKGQMDGGMFGELFVIPDPDNSDAHEPLGFFGPCGCRQTALVVVRGLLA